MLIYRESFVKLRKKAQFLSRLCAGQRLTRAGEPGVEPKISHWGVGC